MITRACHFNPLLHHFMCDGAIFLCCSFLTQHVSHLCVAGNSYNSFHRQIDITCKMSRQVISTQLFLRIKPFLDQVFCPSSQSFPMSSSVCRITLYFCNCCG